MPPRMLHGRLHVMGSLKALAMTALIALLALGVSGDTSSARLVDHHCLLPQSISTVELRTQSSSLGISRHV